MNSAAFALSSRIFPPVVLQWLFGLGLVSALVYLLLTGSGTVALTFLIASTLILFLIYDKVAAILLTTAYLMVLGDVRRIRDIMFPHPSLDALLLVSPMVVIILAVPVLIKAKLRDPVSKAMAYLTILMILQIFNPLQGGITVGVAGALFGLIPVLWFWIAREYATGPILERFLYGLVLPVASVAAMIGIYQTFFGPLPYQQLWFNAHPELVPLFNIGGGNIKSFGFFVSPAEYAMVMAIGAAAAATGTGHRRFWVLILPLFLTALILVSVRGALLKLVFGLVLAFVLRGGRKMGVGASFRVVALLIAVLLGISTLAGSVASKFSATSNSVASLALAHETGGLSDPLNQKTSTVGVHSNMVATAFLEGFRYPIGHGIGYTTGAVVKFGNEGMASEVDLTDTFISEGLVGGFLYLFIVVYLLRYAIAYAHSGPSSVRLAAIAVLICGLGQWILGQSYSTAAIWMFIAGAMTRHQALLDAKAEIRSTAVGKELASR